MLSNASFGGAGLGATLNSLHLQFALDLSKIVGSGSSFSLLNAFSFTVTGDVSNLNVFDVLQGGAKFQVSTKSVDVNVDGGAFTPSPGGDLHNASLTTFGIDLNEDNPGDPQTRFLQFGPDGASLTVQDGSLAVAYISPSSSTDTRRWVAVKGVGLTGALDLGGVVTATAGGIDISYNSASGGASPLNWTTAVDLDNTGSAGTFAADPVTVLGTTVDLTGGGTSVSGSLTGVNVADVLTGSADFNVTKESVSVNDDGDTGTPAVDSVLLAVLLSNLSLRIGTADVFASVNAGTVNVYSASPTVADGRSWLAVDASGLGGSLQLGSLASATLSNVVIRVNRVTGATRALNWASDVTGATVTLPSLTGTLTQVSGHLDSLVIGGFVHGSADFDLSKSLVGVHLTTENLANALLLTLGLSNLNLTVGDPAGVHLTVQSGTLSIAVLEAPAPSTGTDTRTWLALQGSVGTIGFFGVTGLDLTVSSLSLALNRASGARADGGSPVNAEALDWTTALDLNTNGQYGEAGTDQLVVGGVPVNLDGALVQASGSANVNVFGLVSGAVTFVFKQQTVDVDADGVGGIVPGFIPSGPPARGPPDLAGATLTTLGLTVTGVGISIGIANGPSLSVTAGSLALAVVTPSAADQALGDGRYWVALKATLATAQLTGIDGFSLYASAITVEVNQAGGVYRPATDNIPAAELNWNTAISTGPVVIDSTTIDFSGAFLEVDRHGRSSTSAPASSSRPGRSRSRHSTSRRAHTRATTR